MNNNNYNKELVLRKSHINMLKCALKLKLLQLSNLNHMSDGCQRTGKK